MSGLLPLILYGMYYEDKQDLKNYFYPFSSHKKKYYKNSKLPSDYSNKYKSKKTIKKERRKNTNYRRF